jgi:YesN/AraC family two-component response regulator
MSRDTLAAISTPARILLVDDDIIFRNEFVEHFEEYRIKEASNGTEAINILKSPNEIDLVILDVRMSGMDGIEVLERLKQIAPDVRVIILTGYGSKEVAVDALRSRADDYMEKSFIWKNGREAIAKHLETKARSKYAPGIEGKMEHVKDFIKDNCHKKITLHQAASLVSLSPKYLSRIFAEHTRTGFHDYVLSLRMEQAKIFLTKTTFTVQQIADQLGYQNPESFIRQFKKLFGLTPREYRQTNSGKRNNNKH